ncbi:MAG: IreB family regulatory phosphoprotein [Lactobacillales bacterium]|nr:IreB family regulatory phosphoprotein [Lactobacillales bacterium]
MDKTIIYDAKEFKDAVTLATLKEVSDILKERGYNPINQIVGYLMSGDPGYITSYKDARAKITSISPSKILEVIVKEAIK